MSERRGGFGAEIDEDGRERQAVQTIPLPAAPAAADSDVKDDTPVKVKK
jgi:hypothetical protein